MSWGRTIRGFVIPRKPFRKLPLSNGLRYPHHKVAFGESHQQSLHNGPPFRKGLTGYATLSAHPTHLTQRRTMYFRRHTNSRLSLALNPPVQPRSRAPITRLPAFTCQAADTSPPDTPPAAPRSSPWFAGF